MKTAYPTPVMVESFENAHKRGYIYTHHVAGSWLADQWNGYCMDHGYPYINVHEARKGRAQIEVKLPGGDAFTETQKLFIRRIGEEIGVKAPNVRRTEREVCYLINRSERYLWLMRPIATDLVLFFAERIAHVLTQEGKYGISL